MINHKDILYSIVYNGHAVQIFSKKPIQQYRLSVYNGIRFTIWYDLWWSWSFYSRLKFSNIFIEMNIDIMDVHKYFGYFRDIFTIFRAQINLYFHPGGFNNCIWMWLCNVWRRVAAAQQQQPQAYVILWVEYPGSFSKVLEKNHQKEHHVALHKSYKYSSIWRGHTGPCINILVIMHALQRLWNVHISILKISPVEESVLNDKCRKYSGACIYIVYQCMNIYKIIRYM